MGEKTQAPTSADREGFAALAARVLVSRHIASSAEPRLSDFALDAVVDGVSRRLYLHDALTEALGAPAQDRTAVITAWARWVLGAVSDEGWEQVKPRLRPVVRNAWFGTDATLRRPSQFDEHLAAFVAFAVPGEGLRYVTPGDLEAWEIDEETLFTEARRNLGRAIESIEVAADGEERLRFHLEGCEASSLLLMPGRLAPLIARQGAHPAVAIPDRHTFLVLRALPGTLPQIADVALAAHAAAAQPLSAIPYAIAETGAQPLEVADASLVPAQRALLLETYQAQTRVLRQRHPDYEVPEPTERLGDLACAWNEGRHALLPEVASVKLVPKRGTRTVTVEWWGVRSLIGSTFAQEPGIFPPRWSAFAWERDDVRAFDDEDEEEEADPELEAHLADGQAEWVDDEGSGDEEGPDYDQDDGWQEGDPDTLCPFCGSGLKGETICQVCGRAPEEARPAAGTAPSPPVAAPTHAIRLLQALVDGGHLELSSPRALPAVGRAIAETLDGSSDWTAQAASLSARLLSMESVTELFVDDAALAEIVARTAQAPASDPRLDERVRAIEVAEAARQSDPTGTGTARRILRALYDDGVLNIEDLPLDELEPEIADRISRAAAGGPAAIAAAIFEHLSALPGGAFEAESPAAIEDTISRYVSPAPAPPAVPEPPPSVAGRPEPATLGDAKRLLRRLLDDGLAELVAGGSQELVEYAIAELLASEDASDAAVLHALLDEMDEDIVLFADAVVLARYSLKSK